MPKNKYYPYSYAQRTEKRSAIERVCKCGCNQTFYPVPHYRPRSEGGGMVYAEYIKGHNPLSKKALSTVVPWNKGLTKEHPTVARICFQPGHKVFNDWSKVNEMLRTDPELKAKWLEAKRGKMPWNWGLSKDQYPNGIGEYPNGPEHGGWKGGIASLLKRVIKSVYERDGYTCQSCGKTFSERPGHKLHCHHIRPIRCRPDLVLDRNNLITLCAKCHVNVHIGNIPNFLIETETQGGN